MSALFVSRFVRLALRADALVSAAAGAVMAFGGVWLEPWLGLPAMLLVPAGLGCLAYAALLLWLSRRESLPRGAMWAVIAGNVAWAVDCLVLAFGSFLAPSVFGQAFLVMQAVAVLAFAEMQFMSLRRPAQKPAMA